MINISLNEAIVAVVKDPVLAEGDNEVSNYFCDECILGENGIRCDQFNCDAHSRSDGKNVIFQLIDLPEISKEGSTMIELPIGQALVAVESDKAKDCKNCCGRLNAAICRCFVCGGRHDDKNVVFKWADLPKNNKSLCPICPERADCPHADNRTECWEYDRAIAAGGISGKIDFLERFIYTCDRAKKLGMTDIYADMMNIMLSLLDNWERVLDLAERVKAMSNRSAGDRP